MLFSRVSQGHKQGDAGGSQGRALICHASVVESSTMFTKHPSRHGVSLSFLQGSLPALHMLTHMLELGYKQYHLVVACGARIVWGEGQSLKNLGVKNTGLNIIHA